MSNNITDQLAQALEEIASKGDKLPKSIHDSQTIRYPQWAIDIATEALKAYRASKEGRTLEIGEDVIEGDEFKADNGSWHPVTFKEVGYVVQTWETGRYRRPIRAT